MAMNIQLGHVRNSKLSLYSGTLYLKVLKGALVFVHSPCAGQTDSRLFLLTKPRRRRAVSGGLEPREVPPSELKRASCRAERCEGRQSRLSAVGVTTLNGQNRKYS